MNFTKHITVSLFSVGLALSGNVMAHGNKAGHTETKSADSVEKEQTDWGIAGDAADVSRTVTVAMLDKMRFDPESVNVKAGETIRFVLQNKGQIMHEFVLGNQKSLDSHAAMMIKFPKMEHDEPYMAHVPSGNSGEIVWKFNRGGNLMFACLIPGHYQAGMIGTLDIDGESSSDASSKKTMRGDEKKAMSHDKGHDDHGKKKHTD